uniref:Uncharacterized protein n=1 Tax=Catagonus wagneri TaxID=51154 RepID=A0A8C3VFM8_9CETA
MKLRSNLLRLPPKISKPQRKCAAPFPLTQGLCLPGYTPGSCPQLPPLLRNAFSPHDLITVWPFLRPGFSTTNSFADMVPLANTVWLQLGATVHVLQF